MRISRNHVCKVLSDAAMPGTEHSLNNWVLLPLSSPPHYYLASPYFSGLSSPCCFTIRCLYITCFYLFFLFFLLLSVLYFLLFFHIYPSKSNSNIAFPPEAFLVSHTSLDLFIPSLRVLSKYFVNTPIIAPDTVYLIYMLTCQSSS